MKKAVHFLSLAFVLLLTACNQEVSEIVQEQVQEQKQEAAPRCSVVPIDDALAELEAVLSIIDETGQNGVRSSQKRTIKNVENFYGDKSADTNEGLRSGSEDPVFYLVNFEEGGYAVLAADLEISSPVLAVVEEGSVSPSDFWEGNYNPFDSSVDYGYEDLQNFSLYDAESDDYYVASVEPDANPSATPSFQYLVHYMNDRGYYGDFGNVSNTETVIGAWVVNKKVYPMITTEWHQRSPFNDECPMTRWFFWEYHRRSPAGCVPVAVSQIMAYHGYPQNITLNGSTILWQNVRNVGSRYHTTETNIDRMMVAKLVSHVGNRCSTLYTPDWSFALPRNARDCMSEFGYPNVVRHSDYDHNTVIDMLDNDNPVFVAAISGLVSGHAWVVDGYIERSRSENEVHVSTGAIVKEKTKTEVLVHCNWGWGGNCNGYYVSGIFNTKKGAVETESYDNGGTSNSNFTWEFYTITYDHP
jgi:hypothetical protein